MAKRWWTDPGFPQRLWGTEDWQAWERAGSPPVPRDVVADSWHRPLNAQLPVPPSGHTWVGGLYRDNDVERERAARVDALLGRVGVKPRRRRGR